MVFLTYIRIPIHLHVRKKIQVFSSNILIHLGLESLLRNVTITYKSIERINLDHFNKDVAAFIFTSDYKWLEEKRALLILEEMFRIGLGSKVVVLYYPKNYRFAKLAFEKGTIRFINLDSDKGELSELLLECLSKNSSCFPENFHSDIKKIQNNPVGYDLRIAEKKMLQYLWQGKSNNQIADTLCVSTRTIERYRSELIRKTKSPNLIVAIRKMIERGELQI